jgi:hypothetical protein
MVISDKGISGRSFRALISLRTTVACLLLLAVLTLWGTLYQVGNGLYAAQARFFHSWMLLIGGIVPFPGVKLVLIVLAANLLGTMAFRFPLRWHRLGLILTHAGLAILLLGAGFSYYFAHESYLTLLEGEQSNSAASYTKWELVLWAGTSHGEGAAAGEVETRDFSRLAEGQRIALGMPGLSVTVVHLYALSSKNSSDSTERRERIDSLVPEQPSRDPLQNVPGLVLALEHDAGAQRTIMLSAAAEGPTTVPLAHGNLYLMLHHTPVSLPLTIKLIDFVKKDYPGTTMARSFESRLYVKGENIDREVVVSMNRPFRYRNLTFFQTSYSQQGNVEASTLAVVQNSAKAFPYVASAFLAIGMVLHFLLKLIVSLRDRRRAEHG